MMQVGDASLIHTRALMGHMHGRNLKRWQLSRQRERRYAIEAGQIISIWLFLISYFADPIRNERRRSLRYLDRLASRDVDLCHIESVQAFFRKLCRTMWTAKIFFH